MKHLLLPLALALPATLAPLAWQDTAPEQPATETRATLEAPITVIAIRHAEKGTDDPRDPHLTEAGQARAAELARLFEHAGVTHVFTTPYHRTRNTVAPLAATLELTPVEYSPMDLAGFVEDLKALPPGSVAVVAGHSNTTPGLVAALGVTPQNVGTYRGAPALAEDEYDRAFVVTLATEHTAAKGLELRYGSANAEGK